MRADFFRRVPSPFPAVLLFLVAVFPAPACRRAGDPAAVKNPGTNPKNPAAEGALVVATPLEKGPISSFIEVSSDIESLHVVDVFPEIGGVRIVDLAVDEGAHVKKGDVLARLDDEEILLELRQAETELKKALKERKKSELAVNEAKERKKAAEIQKEKLLKDYQGTLDIAKDGLVSDKDLSSDRLAYEQAASDCELRSLEEAKAALDAELAATAADKAAINRDNVALKAARTTVRAPIDGSISTREACAGMTVTTATKLFTIVDCLDLVTCLFLPQEDLTRVGEGMAVSFTCDALPGRSFTGSVDLVSPVVDPTNGTFKIRVRIPPDAEGFLRPGMFINARVLLTRKENALLVPRKAVFYEEDKPCFFIVFDGTARKVVFERGASTDEVIEILRPMSESGEAVAVEEGTPIVVIGQDNLKDGDPVRITGEHP